MSFERNSALRQFIDQHFPGASNSLSQLQGDAGNRSYYRISINEKSYIIMDCPPQYCHLQPFIDIALYLKENEFSSPEIISQDTEQGFLILEDFGSVSIKDYLLKFSTQNTYTENNVEQDNIYHLIIDLLVAMQANQAPSNLVHYNNELLLSELKLFVDYYIPYKYKRNLETSELQEFIEIWQNILSKQAFINPSIVLRDYHVENMMHLEQRQSIKRLGLLDFQDALLGSPIYDLVSVLEDARIDVPREKALKYIEYFSNKKGFKLEEVMLNYHILGAQRNMRIVGVFARKKIRDNDNNYLKYIPRVLEYLEHDVSHIALAPLRSWLKKMEPTI